MKTSFQGIENRNNFRLPFRRKVMVGTEQGVLSGSGVNISFGGLYLSLEKLESLRSGQECHCVFFADPGSQAIQVKGRIQRVYQGSSNPDDFPGVGLQFSKDQKEELKPLEEYVSQMRKHFEVMGTILSAAEPDLRSLEPVLQKMELPLFTDLAEMRQYVERTLHAIELVEQR